MGAVRFAAPVLLLPQGLAKKGKKNMRKKKLVVMVLVASLALSGIGQIPVVQAKTVKSSRTEKTSRHNNKYNNNRT